MSFRPITRALSTAAAGAGVDLLYSDGHPRPKRRRGAVDVDDEVCAPSENEKFNLPMGTQIEQLCHAMHAIETLHDIEGLYTNARLRADDDRSQVDEHWIVQRNDDLHEQIRAVLQQFGINEDYDNYSLRVSRHETIQKWNRNWRTLEDGDTVQTVPGKRNAWNLRLKPEQQKEAGLRAAVYANLAAVRFSSLIKNWGEPDNKERAQEIVELYVRAHMYASVCRSGELSLSMNCGDVILATTSIYETRIARDSGCVSDCFSLPTVLLEVDSPLNVRRSWGSSQVLLVDGNANKLAAVVELSLLEARHRVSTCQLMTILTESDVDFLCAIGAAPKPWSALEHARAHDECAPLALGRGFKCERWRTEKRCHEGRKTVGFAFAFTLFRCLLERVEQLAMLFVEFHDHYLVPFHKAGAPLDEAREVFEFALRTFLPSPRALFYYVDECDQPRFYFRAHGSGASHTLPGMDAHVAALREQVGVVNMTCEHLMPLLFECVSGVLGLASQSTDFWSGDCRSQDGSPAVHVSRMFENGVDCQARVAAFVPAPLLALDGRMNAHVTGGDSFAFALASLRAFIEPFAVDEQRALMGNRVVTRARVDCLQLVPAPMQTIVCRTWVGRLLCVAARAWGLHQDVAPSDDYSDCMHAGILLPHKTHELDPAIDVPLSMLDASCLLALNAAAASESPPLWRCALRMRADGVAEGRGVTLSVLEKFFAQLVAHTAFEYDADKQLLLYSSRRQRCATCYGDTDTLLMMPDCAAFLERHNGDMVEAAFGSCLFATRAGHRTMLEAVLLSAINEYSVPYRLDPLLFFSDARERVGALCAVGAFGIKQMLCDMTCDELRELDCGYERGHRTLYEQLVHNEKQRGFQFRNALLFDVLRESQLSNKVLRVPTVQMLCRFAYGAPPHTQKGLSFEQTMQVLRCVHLVEDLCSQELVELCTAEPDWTEEDRSTRITEVTPLVRETMHSLMMYWANLWGDGNQYMRVLVDNWDDRRSEIVDEEERNAIDIFHRHREQFHAATCARTMAFLCKWLEQASDHDRLDFYTATTARRTVPTYDVARAAQDPRQTARRQLYDALRGDADNIDGNLARSFAPMSLQSIKNACLSLSTFLTPMAARRRYALPDCVELINVRFDCTLEPEPLTSKPHKLPVAQTCTGSLYLCNDYVDYVQFAGDMEHLLAASEAGFQIR